MASCMHAGARVIEVEGSRDGEWGINVLGEFREHESMNYASDVWPGSGEERAWIVSTSFYDRRLCLWEWSEEWGKVEAEGGVFRRGEPEKL